MTKRMPKTPKVLYIARDKAGRYEVAERLYDAERAFSVHCPITGGLELYIAPQAIYEVRVGKKLRPRRHESSRSILKERYKND